MYHLIILFILFVAFIFYAFLYNQNRTNISEYAFASREVGIIPLTATLVMTEFNTATLISFSTIGYLIGLKALTIPVALLLGLLFYSVAVAKKWKEFNGISVADYFTFRYNKMVGMVASIFLFVAMSGFSATYLKSLSFLFENYSPGLSHEIVSAYITILILFLIIRKGLVAIIHMDLISFFIVFFFLGLVLSNVMDIKLLFSNVEKYTFNQDIVSNRFIISLIPLTIMSYVLAPWYGQRIFAAKNTKVAFTSVAIASFIVYLLYSMGIIICYFIALRGYDFLDPQSSFSYALNITLDTKFHYLGYVVIFLISSTTLTGMWSSMSNIILEYIPKTRNNNIILIVTCSVITYILSNNLVDNILNKMILANIPVVALSFGLLAGFYWKRVSIIGVYVSILVGLFGGVFAYINFGEEGIYTFYWGFYVIPLMFILGIIFSLLFPDKK